MLYHVPEPDRAIAELARVLRRGGRLVATTNADDHLLELAELAGTLQVAGRLSFGRENGAELLGRSFAKVERRDADGWVVFDDAALRAYASSTPRLSGLLDLPPLERPLRVRRASSVFVAETA